jgi:hypothetical protein
MTTYNVEYDNPDYNVQNVDVDDWFRYIQYATNYMIQDHNRNNLILSLIDNERQQGHRILCISSKIEHIKHLKNSCSSFGLEILIVERAKCYNIDINKANVVFTSYTFKQLRSLFNTFDTIILCTPTDTPVEEIIASHKKLVKVIKVIDINDLVLAKRSRQIELKYHSNLKLREQEIEHRKKLTLQCLVSCHRENEEDDDINPQSNPDDD